MAKNTGRGTRTDRTETPSQSNGSGTGLWKRNLVTGRFTEAKKSGGAFKSRRAG